MSSGIAYTMQNLGQARTNASVAAVLMSFESVVGAVSGWLALGDAFTPTQIAGCALVISAVVIAQFSSARR
jgi:drug/metabolite transporter (DMT)-like permease